MKQSHTHFIGIGGVGMSGLAKILLKRGELVSGSDLSLGGYAKLLQQSGAEIQIGHDARYIRKEMRVVYTSDVGTDNPEINAAKELGCTLLHRSDLLAFLAKNKRCLAVTGSHGKTTTTSLLVHTFVKAGHDPSFAVGGTVINLETNAQDGSGNEFILEADESDGTFLKYEPTGAIITNIDREHMAHYGDEETLLAAVKTFISQIKDPSLLFWCAEDCRLRELKPSGVSYGFRESAELRAYNVHQEGWQQTFDVAWKGNVYSQIKLSLIGKHNVLNALAVFGMAIASGIPEEAIRQAFITFRGVGRRVEKVGEMHDILILDDYAHHPTEIAATLQGVKQAVGPRRVIALFQPHRYSRLRHLQGLLKRAFDRADQVILTDIYAANEAPIEGISVASIQAEIDAPTTYVPTSELIPYLQNYLQTGDVLVTLGAGSVTKIGRDLADSLKLQPKKTLTVGLICGGESVEHEISFRSSRSIRPALKEAGYEVKLFAISKSGYWVSGAAAEEAYTQECFDKNPSHSKEPLSPAILQELYSCDLLFPLLHGTKGEDGVVQGFLELLQKPYIGCDLRASVLSMDKAWSKAVAGFYQIPILPFVSFYREEWQSQRSSLLKKIEEELHYPLFVKPVHLGSTIGVQRVDSFQELEEAITAAFKLDDKVLVEKGVEGRELEFAVLGDSQAKILPPAEILLNGKIYGYGEKYGIGGTPAQLSFQADLSQEKIDEGLELSLKIYQLFGCSGLARIDFFLDQNLQFWFNEINPMPGLTPTSGYPLICKHANLGIKDFVQTLIFCAFKRHYTHAALVQSL